MRNGKTRVSPIAKAIRELYVEAPEVLRIGDISRGGHERHVVSMDEIDSASPPNSMQIDWQLSEIKRELSTYCESGRLAIEVTAKLHRHGLCAPVEFECLDYKSGLGATPYDKGKLIKRIISFYNTFGGYFLVGTEETEAESRFEIRGFDPSALDIESLKASIKEYTGERIQICALNLELPDVNGLDRPMTLIYVPKRPKSTPPLFFLKDGPQGENKKPVFVKDQIYCRRGDECVEAKGAKILELNAERLNPYLQGSGAALNNRVRVTRIAHNLPDRNLICSKFIGREAALNSLWRWLSDDLSQARVLAGEGGLGKSSIAFEFAERVSEARDAEFEQIIWLTAKEKQFNALEDKYVSVAERHFSSYQELLSAICDRVGFIANELDGASNLELKRKLKSGLAQIPSLIIIDDVDSLDIEEQRQVLELAMVIGGSQSRLLLTTRFNQSYSQDVVIKVSGFELDLDFPQFLESLCHRLALPQFSVADSRKIHVASNGSPLFTESLLRLLRFMNLGDAIAAWRGSRGTDVRAAALKREIDLLDIEAKRVLIAIGLLREVSLVEICEVLGYASEIVEHALNSLHALFLISAPSLGEVPRFSVPENTRRLVLDNAAYMVTDLTRLKRDIETFKTRKERTPSKDQRVANAISQAESFAKVGDIQKSLDTIADARKKTHDHVDLLSYEANFLFRNFPERFDEVRKLARRSFEKGGRRSELFLSWFEAEWSFGHFIGALEAAEAALKHGQGKEEWQIRKSAALASRAEEFIFVGSVSSAISSMFEAADTLKQVIIDARAEDVGELKKQLEQLHDQVWTWAGSGEERGLGRVSAQLDVLERFYKLGDARANNVRRQLSIFENAVVFFARRGQSLSSSQIRLYRVLMERGESLMALLVSKLNSVHGINALKQEWQGICSRSEEVCCASSAKDLSELR
jgi:hypothetical protein